MNGMYGMPDTFGYDPFEMEPFVEAPAVGSEVFGFAGMLMGIFAVIYVVMLALCVVCYILQSIGIYTVAKRRGIHNPWLAWLPVGVLWILGSISDQYQYVVKGRVRNRRKILLGLSIGMLAAAIVAVVSAIVMVVAAIIAESVATAGIGILLVVLFYLALVVSALIAMVYTYIVLYDLYASCDPYNATTYLVLSIFFSVAMPFFIFFSRKKDQGMPPRKETTPPAPAQPLPAVETAPVQEAPIEETPVVEAIPVEEETPEENPEVAETAEETE